MANTITHRSQDSAVLPGVTTKLAGLMAAAAVVLLLVLSMGMSKAGAQTAPVTDQGCTSETTGPTDSNYPVPTVPPCDVYTFVFSNYEPGSVVTLIVYVDTNNDGIVEEITLTATADANGDVVFEWDIPAGFAGEISYVTEGIDEETGEVRTESGNLYVEDNTVVPDNGGGGGGGGPLPYTGSDSTNLVRIGLVLIVAGGISVVAVRRRNAHVDA